MLLGVDYYPEQWPDHLLEEDLDRIVAMGAQAIRIGEFAWHLIEPEEGRFDFSFFDHVIARAKVRGLKIVYGTPTATFPAWLAKKHPEVLRVDAMDRPSAFGGRRQYCYNARPYWHLSERMVASLVAHYRSEPALVMWQLDNELGHEGSDDCYCSQCHMDFQAFLRGQYGHIDSLNETYGTIFWGQTYNDFDEIPMPTQTITTHNPVLKLDWQRFRSFSIHRFAQRQMAVIRGACGSHQPVTHNFYGGYFDRKYDQNQVATLLDVVAYDNYPVWGGLMAPLSPAEIAMGHSYMYGLKQAPFWVMEQLIGAQGHDDIGYLPKDGESSLWAAQAMGRGCNSLFYFRYRGATKGQEQYCQGILDADNRENDKYREVQRFYTWCKTWQHVLDQPLKGAAVALVYDYDNRQMWRGQRQSSDFDYTKALLAFYDGFHQHNIPVDVIDLTKPWQDYPVVLMPVMQRITPELAKDLEAYVAKGGILVSGYRSFIKDQDNNLPFGETAPCYMTDVFGMEVAAYEALGEGQKRHLDDGVRSVCVWRDLLKPTSGARGLLAYGAPYQDYYALTHKAYKGGHAYYVGAGLDGQAHAALAQEVASLAGISWIESPEGVEVIERLADQGPLWLILNHNAKPVTWRGQVFAPLEVRWMPANFDETIAAITPEGQCIKRLVLESASGFKVEVISLGATLTEIWAADDRGERANICLRYKRYEDYFANPFYLGTTIGRVAGRIRDGRITINDREIQLDKTYNPHHLHGGKDSIALVNWEILEHTKATAHLVYHDPYSPGKTPGKVTFHAKFSIVGEETLEIVYEAVSDERTFLNLCNHVYFKLKDQGNWGCDLSLHAKGYYNTDSEGLPVTPIVPLDPTKPYQVVLADHVVLDTPFLCAERAPVVELLEPQTKRHVAVTTDQQAVVVYSGNFLDKVRTPMGEVFAYQEGICFETQALPDAPNLLRPSEIPWTLPDAPYRHWTQYDFTPALSKK